MYILNSPYAPPRTQFSGDDPARSRLRSHAASIFALVPALIMLAFEASMLYESTSYRSLEAWEPLLVMTPVVAMCAISGFAVAERCVTSSKWALLAGGVAVGLLWTLCITVLGVGFLLFKQQTSLNLVRSANIVVQLGKFIVPYALLVGAVVRFYGRKRGFMK